MEKIKISFMARVRNVLLFVLTVTMLLLAVLYIGGSRRAENAAALHAEALPDGTVPLGENAPYTESLHEKGLLPLAFAAIRYDGNGGGAYGGEAAAAALLEYAAEPIHHSLSNAFLLTEVPKSEFGLALFGDCLFLDFYSTLPYQMYYALCGEYVAAARSSVPVNADRLLLSFTESGTLTLYLSDGSTYYRAGQNYTYKATEIAALAADSRLSPFSISEAGVPRSTAAPRTATLSVSLGNGITPDRYEALLTLLGFRAAAGDPHSQTLVDPHGTLRMTPTRFTFSASRDGGIAVSDLLDTAKDALDIGIYDILSASVSLLLQFRDILPTVSGDGLSVYLAAFSREEELFSVTFGVMANGIPVSGSTLPYLAKMTVQNGRFRSIELRYVAAEQSSYTGALFSSAWHFAHVKKSASPRSLRLYYRLPTLPAADLDAAWYYTAESEVAE